MARKLATQVILITGASSGIGEALALEVGSRGARVALLARRVERLEGVAEQIRRSGGEALVLAADVTRDGDIEAAVAKTVARYGRLDVAVANAGFGVNGPLARLELDDYRRQMETNFFGVLRTVYATVEELKATRGVLAVIGSVSAYVGLPATSAYAASKFAVRGLAESITDELRPSGVAVVQINPGFIGTEIRSLDNHGRLTGAADPVPAWMVMPRATAARRIARAIRSRRRELVLTGHGKAGVLVARHAPWLLHVATRVSARMERRRRLPAGDAGDGQTP
ncbi:MAG TPA: SDR family oxidoreductase [Kofleriaceae bacterium]|nr:SDR family oxidoreductase [Kofleriaceae bacterium]